MISKEIINKITEFVHSQSRAYEIPSIFQIDLANEKGQELAGKLGADKDIVLLGTLLMDCMLGVASKERKSSGHIRMSEEKAEVLLSQFPELEDKVKENILYCVRQHHGADKFYSLESEICCNADCYRFASVKGVIEGIRYLKKTMELDELIKFYLKKADEKWNALSLEICKKELAPQYKAIKDFLTQF